MKMLIRSNGQEICKASGLAIVFQRLYLQLLETFFLSCRAAFLNTHTKAVKSKHTLEYFAVTSKQ